MLFQYTSRFSIFALLAFTVAAASAQAILPPVIEWHGKSELLIAKPGSAWMTPIERSGFKFNVLR